MKYTAVIRTLGTAGDKYQILLDSLNKQTIQPSKILVYIAEGYAIPKETIGKEQYIYVKKVWWHNAPYLIMKLTLSLSYFWMMIYFCQIIL